MKRIVTLCISCIVMFSFNMLTFTSYAFEAKFNQCTYVVHEYDADYFQKLYDKKVSGLTSLDDFYGIEMESYDDEHIGSDKPYVRHWWTDGGALIYEYGYPDDWEAENGRIRHFEESYPDFGSFYSKNQYTKEEINDFLIENNINAKIASIAMPENDNSAYSDCFRYKFTYSDDVALIDKLSIAKNFNFIFSAWSNCGSGPSVIIYGDPCVFLTSAVKLQRYLSHSAELDSSEMTDFDLNGDGNLNVIDLIMMKRKLTDMNK